MRVLSLAGCILLTGFFGGCAVYTPSGAVVVDPARAPVAASRGTFCPPGQAKKGNC